MVQLKSVPQFDVVIIGGGPAGLSAAIYTARDLLSTLLIEKNIIGGMINEADRIDNYPGFHESISGMDLTAKMHSQAQKFKLHEVNAEVLSITENTSRGFIIKTTDSEYFTKAIIVASGSVKQKLNIPGEKEYVGRGVSYCATCDAFFYREKTVAVVGGGNSALYEALHLAKFASKVYVLHRRNQLRATAIIRERAKAEPKIELIFSTIVEAIHGMGFVEKLQLRNVVSGITTELKIDGVFVSIGLNPNTSFLNNLLAQDENGMIVVNEHMQTSVPGIFAAGDIRHNSIRQVIAAAGDGAVAAINAKKWVEEY